MDNNSPLVATFTRLATAYPNAYADIGPLESGWTAATDITQEASPALAQALEHQAHHYPKMDARTRGSYLVNSYSWYVPTFAIAAYLSERRVPDFSADNLAVRVNKYTWHAGNESGEGERLETRFMSGRFAALPDDPDANHPDAIILPDTDALREWLRVALEAHFTPLIERVYTATRLGRQAQWNLVADSCAALFLYIGQALGDEARGQVESLAFVKAADSPMKNPKTGFVTLQYGDHCETFRARGGCCRYYTLEDGHKCSTCVLLKPAERDEILLGYMSRQYDQEAAS
jgi:hypothetical protein